MEFCREVSNKYHNTGLLFGRYFFKTSGDEAVSKWIAQDGYWEPYVTEKMARLMNSMKIKVAADVGAFIGYYSFLYHYLGAEKIYALEPNKVSFGYLEDNVLSNRLLGVIEPLNVAAGKKLGEVSVSNFADPGSSVFEVTDGNPSVKMITLDYLFEGKEYPDLIKIDAEGSEYDIILGARKILESGKVKILHIELARGRGYDPIIVMFEINRYFTNMEDVLHHTSNYDIIKRYDFWDIIYWK